MHYSKPDREPSSARSSYDWNQGCRIVLRAALELSLLLRAEDGSRSYRRVETLCQLQVSRDTHHDLINKTSSDARSSRALPYDSRSSNMFPAVTVAYGSRCRYKSALAGSGPGRGI